jgi:hypothetical protein
MTSVGVKRARTIWFPIYPILLITGLFICDAASSKEATNGSVARDIHPRAADAPSKPGGAFQDNAIKVNNGLLTATVRSLPLSVVLEEVSRAGRVAIMMEDARARNQLVSLRVQDVPLDQGLLQILKGYDTFFFYGTGQQGAAVLQAVWVYPKGRGQGLAPIAPELWASTKEIEKSVDDPNPEIRAKAIATLVSRRGAGAYDAVIAGLRDDDGHVRTQALYGAVMAGVSLPREILSTLALTDPSPNVRFLALEALAGDPNINALAEQALADPSPQVQQKAQEILGQVGVSLTHEGQAGRTPRR